MMAKTKNNDMVMLVVLFIIGFMAAFNENTVNVALIYISSDFGVSSVDAQWLVTGYMIVSAIISAICAFFIHRFTMRRLVFSAGIIFFVSSIAGCIAPNFPLLLVFRLIQAIGTGFFVPVMLTTVLKIAPKERLGTLIAVANMCLTLGPALGPVVTGVMISFFGWRTIFLPGAIVIAVMLVFAFFVVRDVHEMHDDRLDVPSIALSTVGLTIFMFGLTQISSVPLTGIIALAIGAAILFVFARRQMRIPNPMLNMGPLFNPKYVASVCLIIVAMMTSFSTTVLLPQYLQDSLALPAFITGMLVLLPVLCNAPFSILSGKIYDKHGEMPILPVGFTIMFISVVGMVVFSPMQSLPLVIISACLAFVAIALVYTPTQTAGLSRLPDVEHAHGVSIMNVIVMIGGALGTSLYGGIAQSGITQALAEGATMSMAQAIGFSHAMMVGIVLTLAAIVGSFVFRKKRAAKR